VFRSEASAARDTEGHPSEDAPAGDEGRASEQDDGKRYRIRQGGGEVIAPRGSELEAHAERPGAKKETHAVEERKNAEPDDGGCVSPRHPPDDEGEHARDHEDDTEREVERVRYEQMPEVCRVDLQEGGWQAGHGEQAQDPAAAPRGACPRPRLVQRTGRAQRFRLRWSWNRGGRGSSRCSLDPGTAAGEASP
jgi:hypothetical protein